MSHKGYGTSFLFCGMSLFRSGDVLLRQVKSVWLCGISFSGCGTTFRGRGTPISGWGISLSSSGSPLSAVGHPSRVGGHPRSGVKRLHKRGWCQAGKGGLGGHRQSRKAKPPGASILAPNSQSIRAFPWIPWDFFPRSSIMGPLRPWRRCERSEWVVFSRRTRRWGAGLSDRTLCLIVDSAHPELRGPRRRVTLPTPLPGIGPAGSAPR